MSEHQESAIASVTFTDAAAHKVKMLIDEEGNPNLNLRAYVTGGGCSGFQYGFTFDEQINEDDFVLTKNVNAFFNPNNEKNQLNSEIQDEDDGGTGGMSTNGVVSTVKLLIDPISFQYLKNAEIDYRDDINGEQFVIRNPNAKTTCGCGSSFAA